MNVIIINGSAESGKDTFVELFRQINLARKTCIYNISTIDKVKEIFKIMGWNGEKDEKSRKALSDLKKLFVDYNDGPFENTVERIDNQHDFVKKKLRGYDIFFFVHCREPEEIQKFVDYYGNVATTLLITRRDVNEYENSSDKNVSNFNYDYVIKNDGSLKDLENLAKFFYNWLKGF